MGASLPEEEKCLLNRLVDCLLLLKEVRAPAVEEALRAVPRRLFLDHFFVEEGETRRELHVNHRRPSREVLEHIYRDVVLVTHYEGDRATSSCSQPAVVAGMLEALELKPGMRVLEIGAGTGWNAALMAYLVGEEGEVVTVDIQKEVARAARRHLRRAGFERVRVITGDGGQGYARRAPYDRIITTASCSDVSPHWIEQLKEGGILVVLLRVFPRSDPAFKFRKQKDKLVGQLINWYGFMRLQGTYGEGGPVEILLEEPSELVPVLSCPLDSRPVPWREMVGSREGLVRFSFVFFLGFADPRAVFVAPPLEGETYGLPPGGAYGLWDREGESACLLGLEELLVYGSEAMAERFGELFQEWMAARAPLPSEYRIEVYPRSQARRRPRRGWVTCRPFCQYIFRP
ncbi:MAG TPA: methyltransferase domain-containing protein [Armatimonadetes bacterium]|nr:methyltransferase domain-containing protein [Armatimonadota bacterium]